MTVTPWLARSKDAGVVIFMVGNHTMGPKRMASQSDEGPKFLSGKREIPWLARGGFSSKRRFDSQLDGLTGSKMREKVRVLAIAAASTSRHCSKAHARNPTKPEQFFDQALLDQLIPAQGPIPSGQPGSWCASARCAPGDTPRRVCRFWGRAWRIA